MIDVGIIAGGGGLMRRPIVTELQRLRRALADPPAQPVLVLVYWVPGHAGRAEFDGFELARSRTGSRHVIAYIEVPAAIVRAESPIADLIESGRRAIAFAKASLGAPTRDALDFDTLVETLDEAGSLLVGSNRFSTLAPESALAKVSPTPSGHETRLTVRQRSRSFLRSSTAGPASSIRAGARYSGSRGELRFGYVDGNEVGQGEFKVLLYGPELEPLRMMV